MSLLIPPNILHSCLWETTQKLFLGILPFNVLKCFLKTGVKFIHCGKVNIKNGKNIYRLANHSAKLMWYLDLKGKCFISGSWRHQLEDDRWDVYAGVPVQFRPGPLVDSDGLLDSPIGHMILLVQLFGFYSRLHVWSVLVKMFTHRCSRVNSD